MKIISVDARNFLSFKDLHFSFPDVGLYFVFGQVVGKTMSNSNGAGKSSLFEALSWGLFGEVIRDVSKDNIVNFSSKGNCFVEVIFEERDDIYSVIRFRNDSKLQNSLLFTKNGEDKTRGDSKTTQEDIDEAIKMNWLVFSTAVVFGEKAQRFAEAKDADKKEIFDEILMLQRYQEAQKNIKKDIKEFMTVLTNSKNDVTVVEQKIQFAENEISNLNEQYKSIELEMKKSEGRVSVLLEKETNIAKNIALLYEEIKKLKEEYDSLKEEQKTIYGYVSEVEEDRRRIARECSDKLMPVSINIRSNEAEIARSSKILANIDQFKKGVRCPTCGQDINEHSAEDVQKHYKAIISDFTQINNAALVEKHNLEVKQKELSGEYDKKYNDAVALRVELENALVKQNSIIDSKKINLNMLDRELTTVISEKKIISASFVDKLKYIEDNRIRIKKNIEELNTILSAAKDKVTQEENELKHLEFWVTGFGDKGVKSLLLDEVIPVLTAKASYYASTLMDDDISISFDTESMLKSGETRDKFNVKLSVGNKQLEYKCFSSGEKRRIDIAILLSLQSLVFLRSASSSNIIVFDEVFDSLDITGIERVVNLLKEESIDKAIFVISHSSEFADFFENQIIVQKENEISTLIQ